MSSIPTFLQIGVLALFLVACGAAQTVQSDPRGALRFHGQPKDALVEIDETHLGPIHMFEKKGVLLRPGVHRVIVRAEGYFSDYRQVEIVEGKLLVVDITLRPKPH